MASVTKDLGIVSAYGYAKAGGYTGTEEEFQAIFNEFTEDAPGLLDRLDEAVDDAEAAEAAAVAANTAAQAAKTAAENAASTFTTDTTLAVSGKAADAKVTGDEITGLKTAITQLDENTSYSGGNYNATVEKGTYTSDTGAVTNWKYTVRTKYKQFFKGDNLHLKLLNDSWRVAVYWYHYNGTSSYTFLGRTPCWTADATDIDFSALAKTNNITINGDTCINVVFFRWDGSEVISNVEVTTQELNNFSNNYIFVYEYSSKDAIGLNGVLIAASNSAPRFISMADYVCTGTNDEITIQTALDDAVFKDVPLYLADGDYYIDSFYSEPTVSESDERFAVLIKKTVFQHSVKICGIYPSARKNGTVNQFSNGAILHVTDTCYNNLSNDYRYRIIMASSDAGTRVYPWAIVEIENIAFTIPNNQKNIIGIDGWNMTALNLNNVFGMALSNSVTGIPSTGAIDANTLSIGVDECVGVRGLQGYAYGVDMIWKNSFMWGFGQGFAVCGEHLVGINLGARFCNYGFTFNKFENGVGGYIHPITLINCCDECDFNMPYFGESGAYNRPSGYSGKQCINLIDYNFEWIPDYYALGGSKCVEKTAGCAYGSITYTLISTFGANAINEVAIPLWESGYGSNMKCINTAQKLKGTTTERLTYAANEYQQFWDTTLNKMTYYIGGSWVDANGTAVD